MSENPNLTDDNAIEADFHDVEGRWRAAQIIRDQPYKIGTNYYFALATFAVCGTVRYVGEKEIVLEPAARIFDTGRFTDALEKGFESETSSEIEPAPGQLIVGREAVGEAYEYDHPVPREQK